MKMRKKNKEILKLNEKIEYFKFLINSKNSSKEKKDRQKLSNKITKCKQIIFEIENEVKSKRKINHLLTELQKLNKLILQQQKLQKNNDAISTQIKIDNIKKEFKNQLFGPKS